MRETSIDVASQPETQKKNHQGKTQSLQLGHTNAKETGFALHRYFLFFCDTFFTCSRKGKLIILYHSVIQQYSRLQIVHF